MSPAGLPAAADGLRLPRAPAGGLPAEPELGSLAGGAGIRSVCPTYNGTRTSECWHLSCVAPRGQGDGDWIPASPISKATAIKCSVQDLRMSFLGQGTRGQRMGGTHLTYRAHVLSQSVTGPCGRCPFLQLSRAVLCGL